MMLKLSTGPHLHTKESTQAIMLDVLIALLPTAAAGVYLFGLRALWVLLVSMVSAVLGEYIWQKLAKKPVRVGDLSALVTGLILGLNLPSSVPLWLPAIGSLIAIILVKQLFGGIGHNFLNPAMLARAALLASWPARMTAAYLPVNVLGKTGAQAVADMTTSATQLSTGAFAPLDLFLGNIPGAIGEVCKLAILLGFLYLVFMRVIGWHIPVIYAGTAALLTWILGGDPLSAVLSGGLLFGAVFMATDYVTTPMLRRGQCVFAVGCGLMTVIIRKYGNYPEGVTYAILFMNILTPLIDRFFTRKIYGEVKRHA